MELPWLDGSRAAIDYYRARLNNAIGTSDDLTIVNECANSGASGACGLISRAADGSIITIDTRYANLSRLSTDGVDFSVRLSKRLPRWGTLSGNLTANYLASFQRTSFVGGATIALAGMTDGNVSWPRWRALAAVDWSWNGWAASYGVRYIGHLHECGDPNEFLLPNDCRVVDDRIYHSATASHQWPSGITVALYVTNIANTSPPRINLSSNANTDPAIYDVLGRVYSVHLSYSVR
jgi:hypothetical protein